MNIFLGIVAIAVCTFIGYTASLKYYERRRFFTDFYNFNNRVINEVSFTQKTLKSLIKDGENTGGKFIEFVENYLDKNKENSVSFINEEEKAFLIEYLDNLGKTDKETQLNFLKGGESIIKDKKNSSIVEEKKYKGLYVKLGFLFGLVIFIAVF